MHIIISLPNQTYDKFLLFQQCPSMPDSQFYDFITNKVKHSLTEPGEAVGLLCAQVGTVSYLKSREPKLSLWVIGSYVPPPPSQGVGGLINFGVDPVSIRVAFCLHSNL